MTYLFPAWGVPHVPGLGCFYNKLPIISKTKKFEEFHVMFPSPFLFLYVQFTPFLIMRLVVFVF